MSKTEFREQKSESWKTEVGKQKTGSKTEDGSGEISLQSSDIDPVFRILLSDFQFTVFGFLSSNFSTKKENRYNKQQKQLLTPLEVGRLRTTVESR